MDYIFDTINNEPWPHVIVKKTLVDNDYSVLNSLKSSTDVWSMPVEDRQNGIITRTLKPKDLAETSLASVFDEHLHHRIFEFWNVPFDQGYSYNVVLDWCQPRGMNHWHCDLGNEYDTCDVITLQWYVDQLQHSRTLLLKGADDIYDSKCMTGDFVMFRSTPHTQHMFHQGDGQRLSIRLRLRTNLVKPTHIHHKKEDDPVGVIIDCKDMESPKKDIEHSLGNLTRLNLSNNGFNNICLIEHADQFDTAVNTLQEHGCLKALIIFAGGVVNENTKDQILNLVHGYWGHKGEDRVYRKYMVIPLDEVIDIQQKTKYAGNVLDKVSNLHNHKLGIYYIHPEETTVEFLNHIQKFSLVPNDLIDGIDAQNIANFVKNAQNHWV